MPMLLFLTIQSQYMVNRSVWLTSMSMACSVCGMERVHQAVGGFVADNAGRFHVAGHQAAQGGLDLHDRTVLDQGLFRLFDTSLTLIMQHQQPLQGPQIFHVGAMDADSAQGGLQHHREDGQIADALRGSGIGHDLPFCIAAQRHSSRFSALPIHPASFGKKGPFSLEKTRAGVMSVTL